MEKQEDLIPFLETLYLFHGLSKEEITSLIPYCKVMHYPKSAWAFREGESDSRLYIVMKGKGEILKKSPYPDYYDRLSGAEPGDVFGEMAYLENTKRSASLRAADVLTVLIFSIQDVRQNNAMGRIHETIMQNIATDLSKKLKKTDELVLTRLVERVNEAQEKKYVKEIFFYVTILWIIYFNMSQILTTFELKLSFAYPLWDLLLGAGILWVMFRLKLPLSFYGLTWGNWKKQIFEGVVYSIPFILIFTGIKWLLIKNVDQFQAAPLFAINQSWDAILLLLPFVFLQELTVRGFLQKTFSSFVVGKKHTLVAILYSNLFYQFVQGMSNFWYGLILFMAGIWWGYLFQRHRSLLGVTISHFLIAGFLLYALDILSILSKI